MSIDVTIKKYGIKYMFVESGEHSIRRKCEEIGLTDSEIDPDWHYWCELSWGSGCNEEDQFDFAFNEFGKTFGQAFGACINAFRSAVERKEFEPCCAALKYNIK